MGTPVPNSLSGCKTKRYTQSTWLPHLSLHLCSHYLARTANNKRSTGWFKQQKVYYLTVLEAGSLRLRCQQGWCLLMAVS